MRVCLAYDRAADTAYSINGAATVAPVDTRAKFIGKNVTDVPSKSPTIYAALLDEAVDVWRPVEAVPESEDVYRIVSETPDGETWAFPRVARSMPRARALR